MPLPDIREAVQKLEEFLSWLAEIWRTKNWLRVLLLVEASLLLFLNPLTFGQAISFFGITIPKWYTIVWSLFIASVFVVALLFVKPTTRSDLSGNLGRRRPIIRGLYPFTFEDAEIFPRLQRNDILKECLSSICDEEFRFGILCGESGSGKSSFLQAGLWPSLSNQAHSCVYVKFNEQAPVDSIRQALVERFKIPIAGDDFLSVLSSIPQQDNQPIVFLFDQFEQFFVHQKSEIDRGAFINDLARWYKSRPIQRQKIIVCIRADFLDCLIELQKSMDYSLGPQEIFQLKKFKPAQAAAVFGVIGEVEGIDVDLNFVKEVVTLELASSKDGLISLVDIQVLAWMIDNQEQRALNRGAYQRLGVVDGLLEIFLRKTLDARETQAKRQAAIQVLLALTDLEKNTGAGTLTVKQIKERARGTLGPDDISEAIKWLAGSNVRLITRNERHGTAVYELAHERLISAIRRVTGQELPEIYKINNLIHRRTNEWLGNERSSRYLLTWRELRAINRYKPYLILGAANSSTRLLITRSRKRLITRISGTFAALLVPLCIGIWWFSPLGQIWQVKRDLLTVTDRVTDPRSLVAASQALAANHDFQDARRIAFALYDDSYEESVMALLVVYVRAGQKREATEMLDSLFLSNPVHTNPTPDFARTDHRKVVALKPQVVEISRVLGKEREILNTIDVHAEHTRYLFGFDESDNIYLLATMYLQLGHFEKAISFIERSYDVSRLKDRYPVGLELSEVPTFEMLKDLTLSSIYLQAGDHPRSAELADDVYIKFKAKPSTSIAVRLVVLYAALGNYQRADEVLNLFPSDPLQTTADVIIARINSNLKLAVKRGYLPRLKFALEYLKQLKNFQQRSRGEGILWKDYVTDDFLNRLRETTKAAYEEFGSNYAGRKQLENECNNLEDFSTERSDQAWLLAVTAVIAAKSGEFNKAASLIQQAEAIINTLDQNGRAELYPVIVEALAFIGDWNKARQTAVLTGNDTAQLLSLAKIMDVWNKRTSSSELPVNMNLP